jgi:hypothetical protein
MSQVLIDSIPGLKSKAHPKPWAGEGATGPTLISGS